MIGRATRSFLTFLVNAGRLQRLGERVRDAPRRAMEWSFQRKWRETEYIYPITLVSASDGNSGSKN